MNYLPRRESAATRKFKSSRATELGVAGHQAAKDALDRQIDTPKKYMDSNHWPPARTRDYRPVVPGSEMIVPGMGHVTTYNTNIAPSGRSRGIDLTRRGTAGIGDEKNDAESFGQDQYFAKKDAKKKRDNNGNQKRHQKEQ